MACPTPRVPAEKPSAIATFVPSVGGLVVPLVLSNVPNSTFVKIVLVAGVAYLVGQRTDEGVGSGSPGDRGEIIRVGRAEETG